MNVPTIEMPKHEARSRLREYRRHIHTRVDAEYQAAEKAYAALARGTPVFTMAAALAVVPRDAKGRPMVAIARCDVRQARYTCDRNVETFSPIGFGWSGSRSNMIRSVHVARRENADPKPDGYALVPMIPAHVRPARFAAAAHWICWSVEEWADTRIRATPDRDPMLLRRLAPDLWAVVATWDLTDVERMVMQGRAHA